MLHNNTVAFVYNPDQQSEQELIDSFVIRTHEFERLFRALRSDPMEKPGQHYIIQGVRGSGKTTLLLRLFYAVRRDEAMQKHIVAVRFPEEQYNIRTLEMVWESILELLEHDPAYQQEFAETHEEMQRHIDDKHYDERAFGIFSSILHKRGKKLIVFIDNFVELIHKFTDTEQHRLREILLTSSSIRIVGGSAVALEHTHRYDKPFYQFFEVIDLKGLNHDETLALLGKLGEHRSEQHVNNVIETQPAKVEILRRLTGGVPRTIVLLFEVFADDKDGSSIQDLELLLDRVTPLYKHRMDDLSTQQQAIVDAIALAWDAVSTKDIAQKVRMESKAVSSQLQQLEKNGIVEKEPTSTKNHLYRIQERFFNIWYLMRFARRGTQQKVVWFVRFLESWCSKEELEQKASAILECFGKEGFNSTYTHFMAESLLAVPHLSDDHKAKLREITYATSENNKERIVQETFVPEQTNLQELHAKAKKGDAEAMYRLGLLAYEKEDTEGQTAQWWKKAADLGHVLGMTGFGFLRHKCGDNETAKQWYLKAAQAGDGRAMDLLGSLYKNQGDLSQAEQWWIKAANMNMERAMLALGWLYYNQQKFSTAEEWLLKAARAGVITAMRYLGILYYDHGNIYQAEQYWQQAAEKGNVESMFSLGLLYDKEGKFILAKHWYTKVADTNNIEAMFNLGLLCERHGEVIEAEQWYLKAAKKGDVVAMRNVGTLYYQLNEAPQAEFWLQKAGTLGDFRAMFGLAFLYNEQGNFNAAITELMQVIEVADTKMVLMTFSLWSELPLDSTISYEERAEHVLIQRTIENQEFFLPLALFVLLRDDVEGAVAHISAFFTAVTDEQMAAFLKEIQEFFVRLIARGMTNSALHLMKTYNLKDKIKPIYYALMHYMKDTYPDEYRRMGSEMKETVEEIIAKIEEVRNGKSTVMQTRDTVPE